MDEELLNDYLEEVSDIMERVENVLSELETRIPNDSDIDELFRNIHTVKGGAGMFAWTNTQQTGHALETYLGECKKKKDSFDYSYVRLMVDKIQLLLENNDEDVSGEAIETPQSLESISDNLSGGYKSQFFDKFVTVFSEILEGEEKKGLCFYEFKIPSKIEKKLFSVIEKYNVEKFSDETYGEKKAFLVTISKDIENEELFSKLEQLEGFAKVENLSLINTKEETPSQNTDKEIKTIAKTKSNPTEMLRVPLSSVNDALNSVWEIFLLRNQISYLF